MSAPVKVLCTGHDSKGCVRSCQHRKPHKAHRPNQTEWDNDMHCTDETSCGPLLTGFKVRCVPVEGPT